MVASASAAPLVDFLEQARQRSQRALLPGDLGASFGLDLARREVRAVVRLCLDQGLRCVVAFDLDQKQGLGLADELCAGRPLLQVDQRGAHCGRDTSALVRLQGIALRGRHLPWYGTSQAFVITRHHSGNRAATYFIETRDVPSLADALDQAMNYGSPFVYKAKAHQLEPLLRQTQERLADQVPQACPTDDATRRWLQGTDLVRSLQRRHAYMSPQEYANKRRWTRELARLARLAKHPLQPPMRFADAALCVAELFADRPWAAFDMALLIDIAVYEAQAVRRDPLGVLEPHALLVRQVLYEHAFAQALYGRMLSLPQRSPYADGEALVAGELGDEVAVMQLAALRVEGITAGQRAREATLVAARLVQPRRADQPIFPVFALQRADADLERAARQLYQNIEQATGRPGGLVELLDDEREPEAILNVLGAYAGNRFYALYDLGPALVDFGVFDRVGPLCFYGSALHFLLQQKDMAALLDHGQYYTLPRDEVPQGWPSLKSYHFWTEALVGCELAHEGFSLREAEDVGRTLGTHYRTAMTPLYLAFQTAHGGRYASVFADNRAAVELHRRGALFGFERCAQVLP